MHGDGYETGQVPLFHVFVRIFGLDPVQNTTFFEKITNQILRLNYAQLICEPVRNESKDCAGSQSIATTLFEGFMTSPSINYDLTHLFGALREIQIWRYPIQGLFQWCRKSLFLQFSPSISFILLNLRFSLLVVFSTGTIRWEHEEADSF